MCAYIGVLLRVIRIESEKSRMHDCDSIRVKLESTVAQKANHKVILKISSILVQVYFSNFFT